MIGLDDGPDGLREEPSDLDPAMQALARRTVEAFRAESRGPAVTIDHSEIPTTDLEMALRSAALSPDSEVYPWPDLYPLVGQTVYAQGRLWTVAAKEHGAGADSPIAVIQLVGCGHDEEVTMARYELRPVSWTQYDEGRCVRE